MELTGPIALTGAGGFVGRRLLARLDPARHPDLRCLLRQPARLEAPAGAPRWRAVPGTLDDASALARLLEGATTVIHLAAVTGKARPERYTEVNVQGTERLLEAARRAGVARVLALSSVAAGFADRRHYPYAESKRAMEALLFGSGLPVLVFRPTMILGPGSPVLRGLRTLAAAPVGVRFGAGDLPVQPVHVDDVAEVLASALEQPLALPAPVGLGGPETLPFRILLERIRERVRGRPGPFLALPLGPVRGALALVEPLLFPVLPLTAGQLASFANPGTVPAESWPAGLPRPERSLAAMLASLDA
jgi:nucleoside-diphosphate-sugar epimerase